MFQIPFDVLPRKSIVLGSRIHFRAWPSDHRQKSFWWQLFTKLCSPDVALLRMADNGQDAFGQSRHLFPWVDFCGSKDVDVFFTMRPTCFI